VLQHCFGTIGKAPDRLTSQEVFAWAYGPGLSGKQPSSVTIGARLACLSSFFHFLIGMEAVTSNPGDALERPKVSVAQPRGLGGTDIQKLLAVVPETPTGLRDRAIVLTLDAHRTAQSGGAEHAATIPSGHRARSVALADGYRIDRVLSGQTFQLHCAGLAEQLRIDAALDELTHQRRHKDLATLRLARHA
jgi:hypothetical protein